MAITKKIQFLRNNTIYTGADGAAARNAAIAGMRGIATGSTTSGDIVDGQAILARYNAAGSASTGDVQTIYGIVHKGVNGKTGVTIYESSELLWAAINAMSDTAMTQTGMGSLATSNYPILTKMDATNNEVTSGAYFANDVTVNNNGDLSAKTSVKTASVVGSTGVSGGTFSGGSLTVTGGISGNNVSANTISAATHVKSATISGTTIKGVTISAGTYQGLPVDPDTAVTQTSYIGNTSRPIVVKDGTGDSEVTGGVGFVTAATINGSGSFSAKTSVSSPSISATTVSATTVKGVTISAGTYQGLPIDPDEKVAQSGMGSLETGTYALLTKTDATNTDVTAGTFYVTAATVTKAGEISAKTSVKAATISGTTVKGNTVSAGTYSNLPTASSGTAGIVKVVETTGTTSGNTVMSQKAVTDAITAALVDVADALVYKGTVSGQSASPGASLPAAEKGDVYKVAASGYVAGQKVEVGDMFICNTDTASGTASTNWDVIQNNIDISDISTTSPLSGGGNVTTGTVTIAHKTITTNSVTGMDQTQIADNGTFDVVTSITTDGYGHPTQVASTTFKLPADSKVTQEQFTGSTSNPIIIKVDSGTSASARNKVYFSSAATIDKTGNIKTTGNVSAATVSANNVTAATAMKTGTLSATTISATTYQNLPASADVKVAQSVHLGIDDPKPIVLKGGTDNTTASTTGGVYFVTAATITARGNFSAKTSVNSASISATNLVTASGFSATAAVSTASTDIDASILLSNGKNTNTIDCGTY